VPVNHSVYLIEDKCKGCTTCLKRCPTEAIRIRDGHAVIKTEKCIDCGECIRVCPNKAKKSNYDDLSTLDDFKWKIAIPAPVLCGQFDNLDDVDYVLTGLLDLGFDDVYEVARAAEIVSECARLYLQSEDIPKPIISSACPAVVRIISIRFPSLCRNVLPLLPPIEVAAMNAKAEAIKNHPELKPEDIGVFFISPCPAKVSYVRNPIGIEKSCVDRVLSIKDIYIPLVSAMNKITEPKSLSRTGLIGLSWAGSGGEASSLFNDKYLAADGIENVIKVLDEIDNENIRGLEFVELNACNGGCVGGAMNVANPYISKARLKSLRRYLPVSQNHITDVSDDEALVIPEKFKWTKALKYDPEVNKNMAEAILKMKDVQRLCDSLPDLDCGSCGAPSCLAFAEDIVEGEADEADCIIKLRDLLRNKSGDGEEKK